MLHLWVFDVYTRQHIHLYLSSRIWHLCSSHFRRRCTRKHIPKFIWSEYEYHICQTHYPNDYSSCSPLCACVNKLYAAAWENCNFFWHNSMYKQHNTKSAFFVFEKDNPCWATTTTRNDATTTTTARVGGGTKISK